MSSPALVPTIPPPSTRCVSGSNSSLVKPSSRPSDSERPLATHGKAPFLKAMLGPAPRSRSVPPRPFPDRCRPPTERRAQSNARFLPAATSAATLASCIALWASIGGPTMSPMAKMCGTLVRICLSTGMKPRSDTLTPAASAPIALPFGARPTATSTRSYSAAAGALSPAKLTRIPSASRLDLRDLGAQQDLLVARANALLQRPHQIGIAPRHELRGELDDAHAAAERVVDAGHLKSDDAAADDQQPPRQLPAVRARRSNR